MPSFMDAVVTCQEVDLVKQLFSLWSYYVPGLAHLPSSDLGLHRVGPASKSAGGAGMHTYGVSCDVSRGLVWFLPRIAAQVWLLPHPCLGLGCSASLSYFEPCSPLDHFRL